MANVFNMGGGTDLVNATLKPGNKIVYSDGLEYHSEIPTEEKIVPVLGSSVVYAPYGLTGEVTALADQGFWFVTGDFVSQSSVPTASLEPISGVTYVNGIADLDPAVINDIAKSISNNNKILYTTETVYIDLATTHRKISVGDEIPIQFGNAVYQFRVIGFNYDRLSNPSVYGSVTATGSAGLTLEMVNVYSEDSYPWKTSVDNNSYVPDNPDLILYNSTLPQLKNTIQSSWRSILKSVYKKYAISTAVSKAKEYAVDMFFHTPGTLNHVDGKYSDNYRVIDYSGRSLPYAYYKDSSNIAILQKTTIRGEKASYIMDAPASLGKTIDIRYRAIFAVRESPTLSIPYTYFGDVDNGNTQQKVNISPLFCI